MELTYTGTFFMAKKEQNMILQIKLRCYFDTRGHGEVYAVNDEPRNIRCCFRNIKVLIKIALSHCDNTSV